MSNKQFKVMVVPRWFTISPETVKALAYVYDYHVRDLPSLFNPNSLNINEALRAKFRLEDIVQVHDPSMTLYRQIRNIDGSVDYSLQKEIADIIKDNSSVEDQHMWVKTIPTELLERMRNEPYLPPEVFEQYNRDAVRQGQIEQEIINEHFQVQMKPEYSYDCSRVRDRGHDHRKVVK